MRLNLHQKIVLGAILPAALVLGLFALIGLSGLKYNERQSEQSAAGLETHRLAIDLGARLQLAADAARRTAQLAGLQTGLTEPQLRRWLRGVLDGNPELAGAGLRYQAASGSDLYLSQADPGVGAASAPPLQGAAPEWFRLAQQQGAVWTPPYYRESAEAWMVSYTVPFLVEGRFGGAAVVDLRLDALQALVSGGGAAGDDWLVLDGAGRILYSRQGARLGRPYTDFAPVGTERARLLSGLLRQPRATATEMDWPGLGPAFVSSARIEPTGWLLLFGRASAGLEPRLAIWRWRTLALVLLTALTVLAVWYRLVRRYSAPLGELARSVQQLGQGGAPTPVAYRGDDELGQLVQGFERLSEDLRGRDQSMQLRQRDLADRVREQRVLYRIADVLGWVDADFAEMLQRVTSLLPEAWAQADAVCARLDLDQHRCVTEPFRETERGLFAPIEADGVTVGGVWIFALEPGVPLEASHQELIEGVAQQLGLAFRRERAQSQLEFMNHELEQHVEVRTEALRQAERLLRDITNSMPGAVYQIHRPDSRPSSLRFVSAGVEPLFGVSREQALANFQTILDRVHPEDYSGLMAAISDSIINDRVHTHVYRITSASGELRWVRSSANAFRQDDGYLLNGYWIDVTDQKRLELALEQSRREADAANEAKSRFLANMSHEIRTPMNAIIGLTHLAHGHTTEPKVREQLGKVEDAAQNLLGLLNDILDFSKIEAGRMSLEHIPFDLWLVLDRVEGLMAERAADKGLRFRVHKPDTLTRDLVGDPLRLSQVLLNLISNAIKFTEAGEVCLELSQSEAGEQEVQLSFAVVDTGIGMDRNQLGRLFSAFTQADSSTTRRFGGTGLGLTICKELVGLMGGELSVQSSIGKGSRFGFELRLRRADPDWRTPPEAEIGDDTALVGARLLVVDDNAINLEVAGEILRQAGALVTTAGNGREALAQLALGEFDAVLMDLQMPVMDGFVTTQRIREQPRLLGLPVLAMTANAMSGDRERCLAAGMNDHIPKPIDPEELRHTLARWLRRRPLPPAERSEPS
ncbi:MAG: ATP-binding protein [Stagnimonas sp.]|nr:ATP-binding protein [Stagnimonas sp.]